MAAESLQSLQGGQRSFQALDDLQRASPAKVARTDGTQKIQADVRRRSSMRDDGLRVLLKVIRWQHVIRGGHKRFEIAPGAACDETHGAAVDLDNR